MNVEEIITTATRMLSAQTPLAPINAIAPKDMLVMAWHVQVLSPGVPTFFFLEKLSLVLLTMPPLAKIGQYILRLERDTVQLQFQVKNTKR